MASGRACSGCVRGSGRPKWVDRRLQGGGEFGPPGGQWCGLWHRPQGLSTGRRGLVQ